MSTWSRRSLLSALLALVGTGCMPGRAIGAPSARKVKEMTHWLGPGAIPIGQQYLQEHSSEASLETLSNLLLERLQGATGSDLPYELSRAVREDFGRDDVVCLEGWVLSRTEVRLCGLAYLANQENGILGLRG